MDYEWKPGDTIQNVRTGKVTEVTETKHQSDTQANWITTNSPERVYGCQLQLEDEGWHKKRS